MSERNELQDLVAEAYGSNNRGWLSVEAADKILAAGYRKPRTITTEAELVDLPAGSVIRDDDDRLWEWVHVGYGGVDKALSAMGIGSMLAPVAFRHYPATVIFEGEAA